MYSFEIGKELRDGLYALSRDHGVTLFMTMLSIYKVLLYRCTGQKDISVGTSIANRDQGEISGLIGFFVNILVLRDQINGEKRFSELLSEVKQTCLMGYSHQDVP